MAETAKEEAFLSEKSAEYKKQIEERLIRRLHQNQIKRT